MIEQLEIENLKSFGGRHCAELAPITVIYGPNSSGKSSLLQALAVLKQTLEPRAARSDIERQPLNLRGDIVDLGSFGAAIHRHELSSPLRLGVSFSGGSARPGMRPRMRADHSGYVNLRFRFDDNTHAVEQDEVVVGVDRRRVRYVPSKPPAADSEPFSVAEGFFRVATKADGLTLSALVRESLSREARDNTELRESFDEFMEYDARPTFLGRGCFPVVPSLRKWRTNSETTRRVSLNTTMLGSRIGDVVYGPAVTLTEALSQLAYLGPLRAAPTRFQVRSGALYSNVGARGEHTPLLLLQQPDLLDPVNDWLRRLDISYSLAVLPVEAATIGAEIGDLVVTRLVDTRSGIAVTPHDVGFGISQLLPVIVQALAGRGRTVCVEQPEIHIHPRLQTMLPDLFIEAAERSGNQLVIETHSEHMMLRFLRRLRENRGDGWLTPDRICVLYVDQDADGISTPRRLALDDGGAFVDEWPNGFFTERIGELFSGRDEGRRRVSRRSGSLQET
jgi:energy-coupling factor transporter ATP-binding protein EcfA2